MRIPRRVIAFGLVLLALDLALGFSHPAASAGTVPVRTGISYGDTLVWMADAQLAGALDDAVDVGAKWVRADLSWQDIEYDAPGRYRWDRFDRVLQAAQRRGLSVLPVLAYTPPWARPAGCAEPACAPADPGAFAAFAQEAARRYVPLGIRTWEIWNEPNIGFWKPVPDPRAYLTLLAATATAIRAVDPQARLVMGGLASTATGPNRISQSDFLAAVARLGGNRIVDAIGYHPYTYPYLPSARTRFGTAWEKIDNGPQSLRAVLAGNGTPDLPVWITEVGAPTGGPGTASTGREKAIPATTTHVTEVRQAEIAHDAIATAAADPLVGAVFWYADRDLGTSVSTNENFFGMRRADGTPKPAMAALRAAIRTMPPDRGGA